MSQSENQGLFLFIHIYFHGTGESNLGPEAYYRCSVSELHPILFIKIRKFYVSLFCVYVYHMHAVPLQVDRVLDLLELKL